MYRNKNNFILTKTLYKQKKIQLNFSKVCKIKLIHMSLNKNKNILTQHQ